MGTMGDDSMSTIASEPVYDFHTAIRLAEAGRAEASDLRIRRTAWSPERWVMWGVAWHDECGRITSVVGEDQAAADWIVMPPIAQSARVELERGNARARAHDAAIASPATATQLRPVPNGRTPIAELVTADIAERARVGLERYGTPLQAGNGRDPQVDAYQEALDQVFYLRQDIEERALAPATPAELDAIDEMVPAYMARCGTCSGGGEVDTGTEVSPRECPTCHGTGGVTPRLIERIRMLVADAARTRSGDVG